MAIPKRLRDELLVEARHRCTICAEKCFEIHHIVEQSEGGSDEAENLIVLCPNCHQHRYHRSGEFTREQLRLYKAKLKEENEVERRLLLNLDEIRAGIESAPLAETEKKLRAELEEAAQQVSAVQAPTAAAKVEETSRWLAERDMLKGGARRAIEIQWDIRGRQDKAQYPKVAVVAVDEDAWSKATDFPAAYTLVLKLDRAPSSFWIQIFDREYEIAFYNMKRRTFLVGDRITMIVADSDNLQNHVNFAKQLVERTNQTLETRVFPEIDRQIEQGKRAALNEFDTIKSLKALTKNLKI